MAGRVGIVFPYGVQTFEAAWWGGNYQSLGCTTNYTNSCINEDWALVLLEDDFPYGHPGWMGYAWLGTTDTQNLAKYDRGYPACGLPSSPSNCQSNHLYGSFTQCGVGSINSAFFTHNCDTSYGQSGDGMYTTGLSGIHIFSIHAAQYCSTCTTQEMPTQSVRMHPNANKRIDSYIFNLMSNLRASYP